MLSFDLTYSEIAHFSNFYCIDFQPKERHLLFKEEGTIAIDVNDDKFVLEVQQSFSHC